METDQILATGIVAFVLIVFGGLIGSCIYGDYQIAVSKDPIATACAMGKEKACTALANRK